MTILVMGQNYWGRGETLAEAKKNFRKQGGVLSDGYAVIDYGTLNFEGFHHDQMGRYHWSPSDQGEPRVSYYNTPKKGS